MWRYLLASSIVVGIALVAITSISLRSSRDAGRTAYVTATGTPGPPRSERAPTLAPDDVTGVAPWAFSALPACFRQVAWARGNAAFARGTIPADAVAVAAGGTLRSADCRVRVGRGEVRIARGADRLLVPDVVRVAVSGARLYVDRRALGREDVRAFVLPSGAAPVFAASRAGVR